MYKAKSQPAIITQKPWGNLRKLLRSGDFDRHILLCDEVTLRACLPVLLQEVPELAAAEIIEIEAGEQSKTIEVCSGIWQSLAEQKASRNTLLVNLGGGVVCDIGGFCAALFKRGMPFIHIPTSLLAMADAAVGGKTGVDLGNLKNAIGTFADPQAVFIAAAFLETLPARQLLNGFAEVLKIALAHDAALFQKLSETSPYELSPVLVRKAVVLKNRVVRKDPFDQGVRKSLNFGHTLGHAIESVALQYGHDVLHGEAVAAGMVIECIIAREKKLMSACRCAHIVRVIRKYFPQLPFRPAFADLEPFLLNDKKNRGGKMLMALVTRPGTCRIDVPVKPDAIKNALRIFNDE